MTEVTGAVEVVGVVVAALGALALVGVAGLKAAVVLGLLRVGVGGKAALSGLWVGLVAGAVGLVVASGPVGEVMARVEARGGVEALEGAGAEGWGGVAAPVGTFLVRNSDVEVRARLAERAAVSVDDWRAALPAFIARALGEGFRVGFWLLLPLMAVDVLVGVVLASGGLAQVPARAISVPLKVLVFLTADGWGLLIEGLVTGYR